jgi:uncharacterized Zn finger protein
LLGVAVAQRADAQRFARGRTYQRQGAVVDVDVEPGVVLAKVQGGRAEAYVVEVATSVLAAPDDVRRAAADSPQRYTALVPDAGDLRFTCSCPDWDDPCKHAVAVLVELGERVADDPRLLERWRGVASDGDDATVPRVGPARVRAARPSEVHTEAAPARRPVRPPALDAFFACAAPLPEILPMPPSPLPARRWEAPWSDVLADALTALGAPDQMP